MTITVYMWNVYHDPSRNFLVHLVASAARSVSVSTLAAVAKNQHQSRTTSMRPTRTPEHEPHKLLCQMRMFLLEPLHALRREPPQHRIALDDDPRVPRQPRERGQLACKGPRHHALLDDRRVLRKLVRCAEDARLDDVQPVWRVVLLPQDGTGGKSDVLKVGRERGEGGVVDGVKGGPERFEERVERLARHVVGGEFWEWLGVNAIKRERGRCLPFAMIRSPASFSCNRRGDPTRVSWKSTSTF